MSRKNIVILILSILGSNLIGSIGSIFTASNIGAWYNNLIRPSFAPPNWVFGPVWTIIFTLIGISFYLIIKRGIAERRAKLALLFFGIQFSLNILWSYLFFALHSPILALIEIIFLWFAICLTIIFFARVDKRAAYLLIPYITWVSFAFVLNLYFWKLN